MARATQLLPFKGGLMEGAALDPDQIRSLSRLPSREVLYGQLVGVVASPVSGLVRTPECTHRRPRLGPRPGTREEGVRRDSRRRCPGARQQRPQPGRPPRLRRPETPPPGRLLQRPRRSLPSRSQRPPLGLRLKDSADQAAGTQAEPENEPAQENDDNPRRTHRLMIEPEDGDANPKED